MSIDIDAARKIANLARIETKDEDLESLSKELSKMLEFMQQLNSADISKVLPMTSVTPMFLSLRTDEVTDGDKQKEILMNAPHQSEDFFAVPKVIE
jgi:aspartyl-tRNA(Asn)/glutamyl-tRNA(Gln) amidotransferase subunit C